jgi:cytochrome P450
VVDDVEQVDPLLHADPGAAHAGDGRRRLFPPISPRSILGGDDDRHDAARHRVAGLFAPEAVRARRAEMAVMAAQHADRWPRAIPVALLPRLRALLDEVFARLWLGVRDVARARALGTAVRRMLWTPGNPPLAIPGEGDGLLGALATPLLHRRRTPLARLLGAEVERRRRAGGAPDDVLGALVRDDPSRPTDAIVDELVPLLMAAQEPPSSALSWLLERLGRDDELAERYAADADARSGLLRETLRLRPPALAALRRLTRPWDLGDRVLPAGVVVLLPIPLLQRDPRAFPQPNRFRPGRWSSGSWPPPGAYLPFGGGARRCLGEHLAQAYSDVIVPALLRRGRPQSLWPRPERMVLRGTTLVPHRGALARWRTG